MTGESRIYRDWVWRLLKGLSLYIFFVKVMRKALRSYRPRTNALRMWLLETMDYSKAKC
jgi:hypothetical protein